MNKKTFLITTLLVALVLITLFFVRIGLDEVSHATWFFRTFDIIAGWAFSILGFVISLTVLIFGADLPCNGIVLILCGIAASSLIWGIVVERIIYFMKRKATKISDAVKK